MDAHPPVPVQDLPTLQLTGPTPAAEWLADARRRDLVMPAVAAITLIVVALLVPTVVLAAAIIQRVTA